MPVDAKLTQPILHSTSIWPQSALLTAHFFPAIHHLGSYNFIFWVRIMQDSIPATSQGLVSITVYLKAAHSSFL
jgi:hypothetical protein